MAQYIANKLATAGADAALVDERGSTTWTDLNTRVNQIIAALRGAGDRGRRYHRGFLRQLSRILRNHGSGRTLRRDLCAGELAFYDG